MNFWTASGGVLIRGRPPAAGPAAGLVLVVVEEDGEHRRLKAVSCSLLAQAGDIELQRAVVQSVDAVVQDIAVRVPGFDATLPQDIVVNGSGTYATGGPEGDNGLSGKKLLLDHYGPRVPIGGTALSGKDFWKPDRAGTLLARRVALAVVRAGVAPEATVQFTTFPGDEAPRFVRITVSGREMPDAQRWLDLVNCRFSARPITNTFGTSWMRQLASTTDVFGSLPMRQVSDWCRWPVAPRPARRC